MDLASLEELGILTALPAHLELHSGSRLNRPASASRELCSQRESRMGGRTGWGRTTDEDGAPCHHRPWEAPAYLFLLPTTSMAARRLVSPPSANYSPRSSLDATQCTAVDALLKQLKACSRRLQAALTSHRTELQVLERLYYKGKNQHRTALFWQRVAEMRKLGGRLDEMHIDDIVESLRLSFWGEPSTRT